ncbi:MaoC family dehydratase N-terminal domain-containing protein [Polycladomyces abyssicola]|nr:MaoC family dehydratase N-terminal domain-containing protein [Polycladomyces abyssicola]
MWQPFIGKRSESVTNWVERGAVKRFAEAIQDLNPLYFDEEVAKKSRWGRLIAPPTFPMTFDYGQIEGLILPESGLIHGDQTFHYQRPLFVGEEVSCYTVLKDVTEKKGKSGRLTFLVFDRIGEDREGEPIFTATTTVVVTEAVKRGMAG